MKETDIRQGTLALMVLKTLDVLGSLHGYGIARRIEQISGDLLTVNQGTLYPVLLKLEQEGSIAAELGASENNRKARFYKLSRQGRKQLQAESLLYAVGRQGTTGALGLDKAGLKADDRERLKVNANYQTEVPNIYAAGDVIGFPALASTAMEQGRLAVCHMFGVQTCSMPELFPYGIYAIPEISMVGKTEKQLTDAGIPYEAGIALGAQAIVSHARQAAPYRQRHDLQLRQHGKRLYAAAPLSSKKRRRRAAHRLSQGSWGRLSSAPRHREP